MAKPIVLFLCTGNSCRSQMAEGWAKELKADQFDACSAGIKLSPLNGWAVQVMAEAGVDISRQCPKHIDDLQRQFDYVVTVCDSANEACPILPERVKHIHVGFDDPPRLAEHVGAEEERLAIYRRVRDEIRQFVTGLPQHLERHE